MRLTHYLTEAKEMLKQWQKYINDNKELAAGVRVLQKIDKAGYDSYLVGGCVRDVILGIKPKDIDIATNAPIDILEKLFKTHKIGTSASFGVIIIQDGGFKFEVAQLRSETYVKPKTVRKIL